VSEIQNGSDQSRSNKLLRSDNRCEPATTVIEKFGGSAAVAKICGCGQLQVNNWRRPGPRGTGGFIPRWYHAKLLQAALDQDIAFDISELYQVPTPATASVAIDQQAA
jgi:hypothetical protein